MKKILFIILLICKSSFAIETCATINPLYGILANITKNTVNSSLILDRPNQDLHSYALTPSDALKVKKCDYIFMINKDFNNLRDAFFD